MNLFAPQNSFLDVIMWKRGAIEHYVIIKILSDLFPQVILYVFSGVRDLILFEVTLREFFGDSQDMNSQIVALCT